MLLSTLFKKISYQRVDNPFKVDIHSHLLPGIDDGVQTLKESLRLIRQLHLLGYSKIITTPHVISDWYPNNQEIINEKLHLVKEALIKEEIDITLEASAEYYVDMNFFNLIEERELLPFMNHYVLFETDYINKPIMLEEIIQMLLDQGYIPVLAHPERYHYLHNNIEGYRYLKALGVLFQINAKSLYHHSKQSSQMAKQLIEEGLVDFIGSDAHRMRDIKRLETFLKSSTCKKMIKLNNIKNNF